MEHEPIQLISKWWLRVASALVAALPLSAALYLRETIEKEIASKTPETLTTFAIVVLALIGILAASLILQRPWLSWDVPTGTWVNRFTGVRYCGTCKANKKIISPLKNEITGWRCVACNTFRTDPARAPKKEEPKVEKYERI